MRSILIQQNFNNLELLNIRFQLLGAPPASPLQGYAYFDTTIDSFMVRNGAGQWISADASKVPDAYIPISKLATNPLARTNHTGTQLAATISDLAGTVQGYRLDQFSAPTTSVTFNGQRITNLSDPTLPQDAATKLYVDNSVQSAAAGIDVKQSVRVISTSSIALSGLQTIDGVTLASGDRVLVAAQSSGETNGVWIAASGAWFRAQDADQNNELTPGAFWYVEEGAVNARTQWRIENTGTITVGTTPITINQFGAATVYTAGNGINITSNVVSVVAQSGGGLVVSPTGVGIDTSVVPRKFSQTIGDNSSTSYTVTHNLNTLDVNVNVYRNGSPFDTVEVSVERTSVNAVLIRFAIAPPENSYRVVIIG